MFSSVNLTELFFLMMIERSHVTESKWNFWKIYGNKMNLDEKHQNPPGGSCGPDSF